VVVEKLLDFHRCGSEFKVSSSKFKVVR
jgi:hypothetical protein